MSNKTTPSVLTRLRPVNPLDVEPKPFVLSQGRIAVVWSMKSACSHVALWAFAIDRLLPAVRYFHSWPHNFREHVYYQSAGYKTARRNFAHAKFPRTILQFTRSPDARLVSIFRHVCRYDFLWNQIREEVGVDVASDGLSLVDFDRFLATQELSSPGYSNPHICAQRHPLSELNVERKIVVNMDTHNLDRSLELIEDEFSLKVNRRQLERAVAAISRVHYASNNPVHHAAGIENLRFRPRDTDSFPKDELLRCVLLKEMAQHHYGIDRSEVGTRDSEGRLFAS